MPATDNPDLPATGVTISAKARDLGDGDADVQDVGLAGLDGGAVARRVPVNTSGHLLVEARPAGGMEFVAQFANMTTVPYLAGELVGDPYELPGVTGSITPGVGLFDVVHLALADYTGTLAAGDVTLWLLGLDPGVTDHGALDFTTADILTGHQPEAAPIVLDRADVAGSTVWLSRATPPPRQAVLVEPTLWAVLVANGPITFGSVPDLVLTLAALGMG